MASIALIAAMSRNRVIGRNGGLPWRIPADLRYFKAQTMGKPVVMGRKTWLSIGKPLPGRQNIVVSRDPALSLPGATVVADIRAALEAATRLMPDREVMVIGGGRIYAAALPYADRLYLTEVHADVAGDTAFPEIDPAEWVERSRERHSQTEPAPLEFSFVVLDRVRAPASPTGR
ncbi:MAG TPA: dihydrofolate reductase [Candidatus Cybelea sp.]|nr:dihydrofolate reductase [Candidatus Cybelea sp.]